MRYKNFNAIHLFQCQILTVFRFYWVFAFVGLWRKVYHCCFALAGRYFQFTVSCMAVLRVWTFASAILGSSALLLPLHRLHRRYLLRSCALLSGSDCCLFWQAQHYIPEAMNSQCHKRNHTKSDAAGKRIYSSCRRVLLFVPVCTARHHLDRFSTRFCVPCLPFFVSFL